MIDFVAALRFIWGLNLVQEKVRRPRKVRVAPTINGRQKTEDELIYLKVSINLSTPEAKFGPVAFRASETRFRESIKRIADMSFDGVELLMDPRKVNLTKLEKLTRDYGLEIPAIGTGLTYLNYGFCFVHPNRNIRRATVRCMKEYIKFASTSGSVVLVGTIRGKTTPAVSYRHAWKFLRTCLRECAAEAEKLGVIMALEPINRYETDIINTVDEALSMIRDVNSNSIHLILDTFHMNIEESSVIDAITNAHDHLVHIHIPDSNRCAPGTGHLDFPKIMEALRSVNYARYVSAEILPLPDSRAAAKQTLEHLLPLLR